MVTTLMIALMWVSMAWAHSEPYCGHASRTHGDGAVHSTKFIRHKNGYHLTKSVHLEWTGTGYTVSSTWRGKELCRHHLK